MLAAAAAAAAAAALHLFSDALSHISHLPTSCERAATR